MTKRRWAGIEGYLILLLSVMSLIAFWYVKGILSTSGGEDLSLMPESEFGQNKNLVMPEEQKIVDYEINSESALFLLREYRVPENLIWNVSTKVYDDGKTREQSGIYTKKKDDFEVKVYEGTSLVKQAIKRGGEITLSVTGAGVYKTSSLNNYKPETIMGMADIDYVAALPVGEISEAKMDLLNGKSVLYVEYRAREFDTVEKYWISLDYGLPIRVESYEENELIYLGETVSLE